MTVRSGYIPIDAPRTVTSSRIPLLSVRLVQTPPPPTTTRWKPLSVQILNMSDNGFIEVVPSIVEGLVGADWKTPLFGFVEYDVSATGLTSFFVLPTNKALFVPPSGNVIVDLQERGEGGDLKGATILTLFTRAVNGGGGPPGPPGGDIDVVAALSWVE